jgi:hypothetical protein
VRQRRWLVWCAQDQAHISKASFQAGGVHLVFLIQICSIIFPLQIAVLARASFLRSDRLSSLRQQVGIDSSGCQ